MTMLAAVLSVLLSARAPDSGSTVQREVGAFVAHLQAGRVADAYALMSDDAKKVLGPAQFAAYVASRRRTLGGMNGVANIRRSSVVEAEHGMTVYEADVRFENGTSPAWFILTQDGTRWRVQSFGMNMPAAIAAAYDAGEMMPIAHEILSVMKKDGAAAIGGRFSDEDLAEVGQTPEMVRDGLATTDALLGPLESYTLGQPASDSDAQRCATVTGEGKFRYGTAPLTLRLCWNDGVWRLRHAQITPQLTPAILERSLERALEGTATAKCPRTAAFPVGGQIVCRVTPRGEPAQDATILRTTESGWKIVALAPAK